MMSGCMGTTTSNACIFVIRIRSLLPAALAGKTASPAAHPVASNTSLRDRFRFVIRLVPSGPSMPRFGYRVGCGCVRRSNPLRTPATSRGLSDSGERWPEPPLCDSQFRKDTHDRSDPEANMDSVRQLINSSRTCPRASSGNPPNRSPPCCPRRCNAAHPACLGLAVEHHRFRHL